MPLGLSDAAPPATHAAEPPGPELQALWFALAARELASVVLVPADSGLSAAVLATDLAEVGRRQLGLAVELIVVQPSELQSPARLAALVAAVTTANPARGAPAAAPAKPSRPSMILAIPPVTEEPLGAAIVHAAGAAVLCVERGRSRLSAIRRTAEILGRAQIAGCFLIN